MVDVLLRAGFAVRVIDNLSAATASISTTSGSSRFAAICRTFVNSIRIAIFAGAQ